MAQTADGISQQAKDLLASSWSSNPGSDQSKTISDILSQLAPTDPASILQLASLNPDELIDPTVMAAITKNIYNVIQASLQDELTTLQTALTVQQQALADQQTALDAKNAALQAIGQAITNIGK